MLKQYEISIFHDISILIENLINSIINNNINKYYGTMGLSVSSSSCANLFIYLPFSKIFSYAATKQKDTVKK